MSEFKFKLTPNQLKANKAKEKAKKKSESFKVKYEESLVSGVDPKPAPAPSKKSRHARRKRLKVIIEANNGVHSGRIKGNPALNPLAPRKDSNPNRFDINCYASRGGSANNRSCAWEK